MSSLLDVAMAMNADATTLSLVDVGRQEETNSSETPTRASLQQEIDNEERSKEVTTVAPLPLEKHEKGRSSSHKVANAEETDDDGYSSFEDDDDRISIKTAKMAKEHESSSKKEKAVLSDENCNAPLPTVPSDSKESKEFLRAVYHGDKTQIRELLDGDIVDANTADQHGWSGLHWAASQNHLEILKLFLEKGCQVNAIEQINGWTALHVAVVRESVSCVDLLLSSGADPRVKDKYGDTVIECLQATTSTKKRNKMLQLVQETRS